MYFTENKTQALQGITDTSQNSVPKLGHMIIIERLVDGVHDQISMVHANS